ncbi:MAG: hypothetical protein LAT78_06315 [Roseinatronobacter sp.]|nr:hypothetical protein [Roseinatronobacter sp.]
MQNSEFPIVMIAAVAMLAFSASAPSAQNAGTSWSGAYSFPGANDRISRLQTADLAKRAESGYFSSFGPGDSFIYNYTTNDHSAVNNINAAEGAHVDVQNRTAEGSGTNSYAVGSINTTTNTINGNNNIVDITSQANSLGCQDGRITTSVSSAGAGGSISGQGSGASSSASGTQC